MSSMKKIEKLIIDNDFKCDICGKELSFQSNYSVDHIIPKIFGGSDRIENLEICCRTCNTRRRDRIGDDHFWFQYRKFNELMTTKLKTELLSYERRHGLITDEDIDIMINAKNDLINAINEKFSEIENLKNVPISKLGVISKGQFAKERYKNSHLTMSYEHYRSQTVGG
ncbi:HNH endonuclease [Staphylococcus sp. GDX7P312P]|nr:HNH endonuclease [Staphylococcus sp. GDX7P312P]KAA2281496.1 HNH endonuclease [Staphylococcus sp. GDX7P459A]